MPVRWRSNGASQVLDVAQRGCRTLFRKAMFLAGDAAHQLSPSGALGTNSGIGDAVDLGWKLGCGAERCGGEGFLFSYDVERRPIGTRNARMTTQFYLKHKNLESGYADKGVGYSGHFCDHKEGRTCCNWCCSIIPSSSGKPDCMRERVRLAEHCDEMD